MAITTTTPYKSGTLSSIGTGANGANTRLNTSGVTWAAGDVGRHVYFYTGAAQWESREIIAQGVNFCDILFPFGGYPVLLPDGVTEVPSDAPATSNSLGVSYKLDDLDDGVTLIKDNANMFRHVVTNAWTIGANVMVHDTNKQLEIDSTWVDLDGILQFGNLDEFGNPIDTCALNDVSTGFGGFSYTGNNANTADDFGAFRIFGGTFTVTGTAQFLRMNRTTGSAQATQVHGVNFDGPAGGRFDGTKSYFLKNTYSRLTGTVGPINPESNIAMLKDITINSGDQVVYHFWEFSGSITVPGLRFNPNAIANRFANLASTAGGETLTLDDILLDDIQTLQDNGVTIFNQSATPSTNNTVTLKNPLTVSTQNSTAGYRLRVKNAAGTEQYDADSDGTGHWPKTSFAWGSVTISALAAYDLTDFTQVGPYDVSARRYDKLTQTFQFDARAPQLTTVPDVADNTIVEATEATVAAYTSLDTGDKLRDRIKVHHVDTDGFEDLSAGGGALSLAAGTDVNGAAAYNLTINSAAGSAIVESAGTITINPTAVAKGSVYVKLIVPATKLLTIAGTSTLAMDLDLIGSATIPDIDRLTGTLTMTGASVLTINASGGGDLPSGTAGASAKFVVSASVANDEFDASAFVFDASTVIENTSGNNINLALAVGQQAPTKLETSGTITFVVPTVSYPVSVTSIVAGSRLQIYNVTTATEIYNAVVVGTSYTTNYDEGTDYTSGDTVRVRLAEQSTTTAKLAFEQTTVASTGWAIIAAQEDDTVYNIYGVDGSGVTGFAADYGNDEIDVTVAADFTATNLYAWYVYNLQTEVGIREFTGGMTAIDAANLRVNNAVLDAYIDNTTSTNIKQTDNIRIYRSDEAYPVKSSGGGGIDIVWRDKIFLVETGVSGLTAAESTKLDATALETSVQLSIGVSV